MESKAIVISTRITAELLERLDSAAADKNLSRSTLITRALTSYLASCPLQRSLFEVNNPIFFDPEEPRD